MSLGKQKKSWFSLYLAVLVSLFFVQIWPEVAGFTLRLEDVLILLLWGGLLITVLFRGRLRYRRSHLNGPLLALIVLVMVAVLNTFYSPFTTAVKQDALVNGIRLILAVSLFFVVYNYPLPVGKKMDAVFGAIVGLSLVTTAVSLLQIAHWNDWLPFSLPSLLIELQKGANTARGREIFALYIGNTGTHTWSGMLALQAMVIWFYSWQTPSRLRRSLGLLYFLLLVIVLVRISVRNSILGLVFAISVIFLLTAWQSRYVVNRFVKPLLLFTFIVLGIFALFTFGAEYYFTQRILQTLPQLENGQLIISRASNIYGRLDYLAAALTIFQSNPLLGGGFYSFAPLSNSITGLNVAHAHNAYAQTLAEMGLLGGLVVAWLIIAILALFVTTRFCLKANRRAAFLWQTTAAYFLFLAYTALFSNNFWSPTHLGIGLILLGLLATQVVEPVTS